MLTFRLRISNGAKTMNEFRDFTLSTDEPATVGLTTYEAIRRDIISGKLRPNAKLKLAAMKAAYAASVPTLREALNRLASEGFVHAAEQRGFFVAPVSAADLREIADLRLLLECDALKSSFQNGDTEWEAQVAAAHHKLQRTEKRMKAGELSQKPLWKRYDWEFHQALVSACGSANLLQLHAIIFAKYLRYQMQVLTFRGTVAALEHRHLFDAAMDRDAKRAVKLLRAHVKGGLDHALKEQAARFDAA